MLRAELHCHSEFSRDADTALDQLITLCKERQIDVIALTDHNEIAGAVRLKQLAPKWLKVIVAEEIASAEGDIIGLFLQEKIPARLSVAGTIAAIRAQGGLVLIPHPFDRIRHEAVGLKVVEEIKDQIDFIEIFNSRCLIHGDNQRAKQYATAHNIPAFVGSDAHTRSEYGRSVNVIEPFKTPAEFKANLEKATFVTRYASPFVHAKTKLVKIKKRKLVK